MILIHIHIFLSISINPHMFLSILSIICQSSYSHPSCLFVPFQKVPKIIAEQAEKGRKREAKADIKKGIIEKSAKKR